jgi:hypothetical protein
MFLRLSAYRLLILPLAGLFWLGAEVSVIAKDSTTHFELVQKSQAVDTVIASISEKALRVYSPSRGFVLVSKAPSWGICIYNDRMRQKYITDEQHFRFGGALQRSLMSDAIPSLKPPIKETSSTVHGVPVKILDAATDHDTHVVLADGIFRSSQMNDKPVIADRYSYMLWKQTVPRQISRILEDLYRAPREDCLPLSLTLFYTDGTFSRCLTTLSIKEVPGSIVADEPGSYTRIDGPASLVFGANKKDIEDIFGKQIWDGAGVDKANVSPKSP